VAVVASGLAAKGLLLGWGGHEGFTACYRALDVPPRIGDGCVQLRPPATRTQAVQFLILLTPALYLAPHLFMQVNHVRHLVIPHLAMAAVAVYASTVITRTQRS